ncbi:MAG: hypothetical protein HYV08_08810 [Deltaproteobacteria bacterium]|nr:hypothetical protein [Deltaproteobacteria bacterium]MBI3076191.1 hypothetical protein [Deltaproteobacteria bacterium]
MALRSVEAVVVHREPAQVWWPHRERGGSSARGEVAGERQRQSYPRTIEVLPARQPEEPQGPETVATVRALAAYGEAGRLLGDLRGHLIDLRT